MVPVETLSHVFLEGKTCERMVVSNNHTETRVETISPENNDVEDVVYLEIDLELSFLKI